MINVLLLFRKCQKVLGKNMDLWENEVYRFKTIGQLKVGISINCDATSINCDVLIVSISYQSLLSDFRPSASIYPEGTCVSDQPSMK